MRAVSWKRKRLFLNILFNQELCEACDLAQDILQCSNRENGGSVMGFRTDTIAAISTAMTNSGIGIVRISGEDAFDVIDKIYKG